ncbi:MAG TPA: hypothetical protein PLS53_11900, partial [Thermoanaerobaculaceae bacterium]|nr:hypothetical protein [Thermoanaerobaculaceae bacterium]
RLHLPQRPGDELAPAAARRPDHGGRVRHLGRGAATWIPRRRRTRLHASRVLGLRVTIVGRSPGELMGAVPAGQPLSAEDHILPDTTTRDRIRRHLVSANALIRNRAPST